LTCANKGHNVCIEQILYSAATGSNQCQPPHPLTSSWPPAGHVLKGRFKVRIGDEVFELLEGGFAYLPSTVPHTFVNLTDQAAEINVVYTPGGGHRFYEELGPATRNGHPDRAVVAAIFEKHGMSLLGPPLSAD
jgi:hypothetical protein